MNTGLLNPFALLPHEGEVLDVVGDRVRIFADGAKTGGQCTIIETITQPGMGPPLHRHEREDEYFFVCEGTMKFSVDGKVFTAGPGSFVLAPRGSLHTFMNAGPAPSRMVVSVTPAGFEKAFRACSELMARNPKAGPAELGAVFAPYGVTFHGPPLSGM